jgi:hypothetical protein
MLKMSTLCTTLVGNKCPLLTVTNFTSSPDAIAKRRAICISARVHPGETCASWTMQVLTLLATGVLLLYYCFTKRRAICILCARAPRRNLRVVDYAGRFIAVSLYYAGRFTVLLLLCCLCILLLYYCFTKRRAICILCARARDETCASWTMQVLSLPALLVQMYSVYLLYWYKGIQFTCWNLRGVGYTAAD